MYFIAAIRLPQTWSFPPTAAASTRALYYSRIIPTRVRTHPQPLRSDSGVAINQHAPHDKDNNFPLARPIATIYLNPRLHPTPSPSPPRDSLPLPQMDS